MTAFYLPKASERTTSFSSRDTGEGLLNANRWKLTEASQTEPGNPLLHSASWIQWEGSSSELCGITVCPLWPRKLTQTAHILFHVRKRKKPDYLHCTYYDPWWHKYNLKLLVHFLLTWGKGTSHKGFAWLFSWRACGGSSWNVGSEVSMRTQKGDGMWDEYLGQGLMEGCKSGQFDHSTGALNQWTVN